MQCCPSSVLPTTASQPFSGSPLSSLQASTISHLQFAPVWPNRWKQCSYRSFTTDSISPGFSVEAGSSPALTCSSHLHLPTRHLGRQAVIWVCLPDRYSPELLPPGAHLYLQGALSPAKVIYVWLDLYRAAFVSDASASQCWNCGGIETSSCFITRKWRSWCLNVMPNTLVFWSDIQRFVILIKSRLA